MKINSLIFLLVGAYLAIQSFYFLLAMGNGFVMTIDTFTDVFILIIMLLSFMFCCFISTFCIGLIMDDEDDTFLSYFKDALSVIALHLIVWSIFFILSGLGFY